ncbi:mitochondrial transcription termination factor family protein [Wolffia australiana]
MLLFEVASVSKLLRRRLPAAGEINLHPRLCSIEFPRSSGADSLASDLLLRYDFSSFDRHSAAIPPILSISREFRIQRLANELRVSKIVCAVPGFTSLVTGAPVRVFSRTSRAFSVLGFPEPLWRSGNDLELARRTCRDLREAGFEDETIARVLEEYPYARMDLPEIKLRIDLLRKLGLSKEEINRVVWSFPGLLTISLEQRLKPLLNNLRKINPSGDELRPILRDNPRLLLSMDVGELPRYVELLANLKCRPAIKNRVLRGGHVVAGIRVKRRVDLLCRHGLTRRDALEVLRREPRAMLYDMADLEKKIDFLVRVLELGAEWLTNVPEFLGVNLEKRVIPRYNAIEHLKSKKNALVGFPIDLGILVKMCRNKFRNMFLRPYPDCEEMLFLRPNPNKPKKHLNGLWNLFKPPEYPKTRDDLRNMRLFMEPLVSPDE